MTVKVSASGSSGCTTARLSLRGGKADEAIPHAGDCRALWARNDNIPCHREGQRPAAISHTKDDSSHRTRIHSTISGDTHPVTDSPEYSRSLAAQIARRLTPGAAALSLAFGAGLAQADTFTVTNADDDGPGSLRQAIADANANNGDDTIDFDDSLAGETITLTSGGLQLTDTTGTTTIEGPGADQLTVSGNNDSFVLSVDEADATAAISGLTFSDGNVSGIGNFGMLDLTDCIVTGNSHDSRGGGVLNQGDLTLTHSTVTDNYTPSAPVDGSSGAGIFNSGTVILTHSTVSDNTAAVGFGGGINNTGDLTLTNSTVSGNSSDSNGGGVHNSGSGSVTLTNSTVSGNSAANGGGINIRDGAATARNSLVVNNTADTGGNCHVRGGTFNATGTNYDDDGSCVSAETDGTQNFFEDADAGNRLEDLAFNGGPTQTHALQAGNPAIDNADASICAEGPMDDPPGPDNLDQRGVARPIPGGGECDVGAYEAGADFDLGDAPAPYPTLLANNGATHVIHVIGMAGPILGGQIDVETDGQPTAGADGDDTDMEGDDEDGLFVTPDPLVGGMQATFEVTVSNGPGLVNAWLDLNQDGDWNDAGEQVLTDVSIDGSAMQTFTVPDDVPTGETFARIRVSTDGGDAITGMAMDGEVEDYRLTIEEPAPPPPPPAEDDDDDKDDCDTVEEYAVLCIGTDGGCTLGRGGDNGLGWITLLAALGLWQRYRRRQAVQKE